MTKLPSYLYTAGIALIAGGTLRILDHIDPQPPMPWPAYLPVILVGMMCLFPVFFLGTKQ